MPSSDQGADCEIHVIPQEDERNEKGADGVPERAIGTWMMIANPADTVDYDYDLDFCRVENRNDACERSENVEAKPTDSWTVVVVALVVVRPHRTL